MMGYEDENCTEKMDYEEDFSASAQQILMEARQKLLEYQRKKVYIKRV